MDREKVVPINVPILGHDLTIRLDPFCMEMLNWLTRQQGPRASRNEMATGILTQSLHNAALNVLVADTWAAVMVNWGMGKSPLIGPVAPEVMQ